MSKKLTPWFPANVKPVHVGVYQTSERARYQYWDGKNWGFFKPTPAQGHEYREDRSSQQDVTWRGLAKKP